MTSRLQPEPESLVLQEHHTTRSDHEPRSGDVDRAGLLRERIVQGIERFEKGPDRFRLAVVDRRPTEHRPTYVIAEFLVHLCSTSSHLPGVAGVIQITCL